MYLFFRIEVFENVIIVFYDWFMYSDILYVYICMLFYYLFIYGYIKLYELKCSIVELFLRFDFVCYYMV